MGTWVCGLRAGCGPTCFCNRPSGRSPGAPGTPSRSPGRLRHAAGSSAATSGLPGLRFGDPPRPQNRGSRVGASTIRGKSLSSLPRPFRTSEKSLGRVPDAPPEGPGTSQSSLTGSARGLHEASGDHRPPGEPWQTPPGADWASFGDLRGPFGIIWSSCSGLPIVPWVHV